jgi:hypothetical protein
MSALPPARSDFPPRTDPAWNEAHERVESYLRAHHIAQPIALAELTDEIVARAWQDRTPDTAAAPVTLALREADRAITAWFARVLTQQAPHSRRLGVRGRLALALADAPGRWPSAFLAPTPPPQALSDAMRAAFLRAGPAPQLYKMTAQAISLGCMARLLGWCWAAIRRRPALRLLARLVFIAALAALLFFAFR